MEKKIHRPMLWIAVVLFFITSCDKTEQAGHKFVKGGCWSVTSLTAGQTEFSKLPRWRINPSGATEQSGTAAWEHAGGSTVNFQWEFSNMGGTFEFFADAYESDCISMACSQCRNFSGQYKVIRSGSKQFHFESDRTTGYPGKLVTILLEAE